MRARLAAERERTPLLIFRDGDGEQLIIPLVGDRATIGRREGNEICLSWDAAVSRTHAILECVNEDWTLLDDGLSKHGTFVNGERLDGRRRLQDGDTIYLGT